MGVCRPGRCSLCRFCGKVVCLFVTIQGLAHGSDSPGLARVRCLPITHHATDVLDLMSSTSRQKRFPTYNVLPCAHQQAHRCITP